MITYRFQAWRIMPRRAGEFHRTSRPVRWPTAMLMTRVLDGGRLGLLRLARPDQHKSRCDIKHARPAARTGIFRGPYHSGALQCVRKRISRIEFFNDARPRSRPLASVAAHRMASLGYAEFPF